MSAEWDCQKHGTSNLGQCPMCEAEAEVHQDCLKQIDALKANVERYREALEKIKRHQKIVCHSAIELQLSTTWNIANAALGEGEKGDGK